VSSRDGPDVIRQDLTGPISVNLDCGYRVKENVEVEGIEVM
jgi:hypothetical protein